MQAVALASQKKDSSVTSYPPSAYRITPPKHKGILVGKNKICWTVACYFSTHIMFAAPKLR